MNNYWTKKRNIKDACQQVRKMVDRIREVGIENVKFSKIENSAFDQYLEEYYNSEVVRKNYKESRDRVNEWRRKNPDICS